MEFGLFIQGYVPEFRRAGDPDAEHHAFDERARRGRGGRRGRVQVRLGDRAPLPRRVLPPVGQRRRARLSGPRHRAASTSGRASSTRCPQVNHPAKVAERVAMLDHLSDGRFEFGTGRGAGQPRDPRVSARHRPTLGHTREIWEDVIGEFPKMWMQDTYEGYEGKYWSLPPRKILPKPYVKPHPPMWYAAGNPSSYEMAAHKGLGVLGFSVGNLDDAREPATGLQEGDPGRRAGRRLRERQHHGVHRRRRSPRTGDGPGSADRLPPELPHLERLPVPRHVPAPTPRAGVARADPGVHARDVEIGIEAGALIVRRPERGAGPVPALGGGRCRPARLRHRSGPTRRHARDDPPASVST